MGAGPLPVVPDAAAARAPLRQAVAAWQADARGASKLCIMLEHQYTEVTGLFCSFYFLIGCNVLRPSFALRWSITHQGGFCVSSPLCQAAGTPRRCTLEGAWPPLPCS